VKNQLNLQACGVCAKRRLGWRPILGATVVTTAITEMAGNFRNFYTDLELALFGAFLLAQKRSAFSSFDAAEFINLHQQSTMFISCFA